MKRLENTILSWGGVGVVDLYVYRNTKIVSNDVENNQLSFFKNFF